MILLLLAVGTSVIYVKLLAGFAARYRRIRVNECLHLGRIVVFFYRCRLKECERREKHGTRSNLPYKQCHAANVLKIPLKCRNSDNQIVLFLGNVYQ